MIDLEDARWAALKSNYGDGRRVAELLKQAFAGQDSARWYDDLFQELCHQYTVSESAYAAVPHLVRLIEAGTDARVDILVLIGACRMSSLMENADLMPPEFQRDWDMAIRDVLPIACLALADPGLTANELRYLLAAVAALHGEAGLADLIEAGDSVG